MSSELHDQLQTTLGQAYRLDRELGGGGMSRVFVAEEKALGRTVVVKVLPRELAADVNVDRFNREILLAAKLQHPHIVPVLSAGTMDGLPYFTMPFVDGESLRGRLSRGPLSTTEAISVLRDVAKALAYAHERGVVHRDIKPDNVMLTGGAAVVADFGIAKALAASRARQDLGGTRAPTLTQLGTSIGTPTYMAPEQAAGDPGTDHRADLYALGCVGYELLAGHPPFHGLSPQRLLAAHMGEEPRPIAALRPDAPPLLAELVMRCLAKDPDARPGQASDVVRILETVTSGSAHEAMPAVLLGRRGMTTRALGAWAVAFLLATLIARVATTEIGLPTWVLPGTVLVMLLGLPAILLTGYLHRAARRELTHTPVRTPGGSITRSSIGTLAMRAAPLVSWRRTAWGGALAMAVFVLMVGGFLALRTSGVGPFATLMSLGKLEERERILVAEFSGDTALGPVLAEAARTGLSQSSVLSLVQPTTITSALQRMEREPSSRLDAALAREVARREGINVLVTGDVRPLGTGYVVTMRLVGTDSGQTLASIQETAPGAEALIGTVGSLTTKLRERVGESLKSVRSSPRLEQVTTASLPALEKYTKGITAVTVNGDFERGSRLLEEAIALDTGFAMAYRRLAIEIRNHMGTTGRVTELLESAYRHRHRLTEAERYLTEGSYFSSGPKRDPAKALAAYENLIALRPGDYAALNNAAVIHSQLRNGDKAEELYRRALDANPSAGNLYSNLAITLFRNGKKVEAAAMLQQLAERSPAHPNVFYWGAGLQAALGNLDSATRLAERLRDDRVSDPVVRMRALGVLRDLALTRGRLTESRRWGRELAAADSAFGTPAWRLREQLDLAALEAWVLERGPTAVSRVDAALARSPLDSIPVADQPLPWLVTVYAMSGRADRARSIYDRVVARDRAGRGSGFAGEAPALRGQIAFAEGRFADAVREFRASDVGECRSCALPMLGLAYDNAGSRDSAIAVLQRYVDTPDLSRFSLADPPFLAGSHKRLGELYEARNAPGDRQRAASHYGRFVALWERADPELQPKVQEVRGRLARLERGS